MAVDYVRYLNANQFGIDDVLYSKLIKVLSDLKQGAMPAGQWLSVLKSLPSSKGVKQSEITDCQLESHLGSFAPEKRVPKSELVDFVAKRLPLIKRIDLAHPKYAEYVTLDGAKYTERLYVLSSERMAADDEIEDLMYQIEELGFDPSPLLENPDLVDQIENRMKLIRGVLSEKYDFSKHHFSKNVEKHGKNLMAHARFQVKGGQFFIQEIQSDWAQKGRRNNWNENYPKAPFVTETSEWAAVVLRDLLNEAANNPDCKSVSWINGNLRNGWNQSHNDNLDYFYDTIVRKIVEKSFSSTGQKTKLIPIVTKNGQTEDVLGFEMTDAVRAELKKAQPLYTREGVMPWGAVVDEGARDAVKARVVQECERMTGSAKTIRFVSKLYDYSTGNEVAAQYVNAGITLSLRAATLDRAARHELWHFAHENLLLPHEKIEMRLAFGIGSQLNTRTVETLNAMGLHAAAQQCVDHQECAAHAFSLWMEGRMSVEPKTQGIFWSVVNACERISDWVSEKVFGVKISKPEDLFVAMREGALQARQAILDEAADAAIADVANAPKG